MGVHSRVAYQASLTNLHNITMKFLAVIIAAVASVAQASPQFLHGGLHGLTYLNAAAAVATPACIPEQVQACQTHLSAFPNGINCEAMCSLCDLCDATPGVDNCKYCTKGVDACTANCRKGVQVCAACTFGK